MSKPVRIFMFLKTVRLGCCNHREINKAFCGFCDDSKYQLHERVFLENCLAGLVDGQVQDSNHVSGDDALVRDFRNLQYRFSSLLSNVNPVLVI